MSLIEPIYTALNCAAAYQLNWSLILQALAPLPPVDQWLDALRASVEPDGVRVLEACLGENSRIGLFLSTKPHVSPQEIIRSVKGRLQYELRDRIPKAFRRNYRLTSVGAPNLSTLQHYIGEQPNRHPMADARVQRMLEQLQFHDLRVDLSRIRRTAYGEFIYNLHVVLENKYGWREVRESVLDATRTMIIGSCRKHRYLLSRIGLICNHLHLALGCGIADSPEDVALMLLNNLAYAQGMIPYYRDSYYVGTFGPYDREAIRRQLR